MPNSDHNDTVEQRRVELWVRSSSPVAAESACRESVERLDSLVRDGVLSDRSVRLWGKAVGTSTTAARTERAREVLDTVASFREWAARRDRELTPYFRTREATSAVTDESYTVQVLPVRALAEYRGDDLAFVAPSTHGDTTCSVRDRIDALGTGADPVSASPDGGRSDAG
ncbi:hypothetical protein BRD00_00525 [Halobacteriales archaeon QS_8_69_26]|nr:MAG: hypothetical protein BRD00_00525 [Halobacteriales archaeon QS_8_69_26]